MLVAGGRLLDRVHLAEEELVVREEASGWPRARLALDENLHGAVGQAQQLNDDADRADPEDVIGSSGSLVFAFFCGGKENLLVLVHRLFEGVDRLLAPDEERHDHVRGRQ